MRKISLLIFIATIILSACVNKGKKEDQKIINANNVIPFFQHWNLILGDGLMWVKQLILRIKTSFMQLVKTM